MPATPPPLRLMHLMLSKEQGGAERFFMKLARAMDARGVPQRLVVEPGLPWEAEARADGLDVAPIAFGGWREPLARRALSRAVRSFRPDIVLAWMGRSAKRLPQRRAGETHINCVRYGGYFGLKQAGKADHVIVNTPDLATYVADQGVDPGTVHVCVNFGGLDAAAPASRAALDTPEGAPVVLALGRLVEKKGFDVLLRAVAKVPDHYLWLAGAGAEKDALEALAAELSLADRVRFLGWRDDQAALLAAADVVCVSSRSEPFGNVVVEAWASGTPLVATRSEGPGWLVTDEEDGLLVPIDDADSLASAFQRLAADPGLAERLAAKGRETHAAHYSQDAVVRRYLDLFASLKA
ncbi:MAG: glycosyltransferase [Pseudomonadota bacterium]